MSTPPVPVWILAAPFSGASWLASCLGGHPELYATPELNLLMADTVGELLDIFDIGQGAHAHGLLRTLAQLEFRGQTDAGVVQARSWLEARREMCSDELLLWLAEKVAPRRLVMPDSEAALRPMSLRRLLASMPESSIIHLVRHPWEQGCLLAAWARERLFVPPDFKDHAFRPPQVDPQIPWLRANANLDRLHASWPADRWRLMRSEEVENDTDRSLAGLCSWLGVADDAAAQTAMQQPKSWTYASPGPGRAAFGLEAELTEPFSTHALQLAARVQLLQPLPWRDDGAGFDPQVRSLALRLGYAAE